MYLNQKNREQLDMRDVKRPHKLKVDAEGKVVAERVEATDHLRTVITEPTTREQFTFECWYQHPTPRYRQGVYLASNGIVMTDEEVAALGLTPSTKMLDFDRDRPQMIRPTVAAFKLFYPEAYDRLKGVSPLFSAPAETKQSGKPSKAATEE